MIRGDLHIHTRRSDGSYCYREAILNAKEKGLAFVSFTEHDTVAGRAEAFSLGLDLGINVIPGIEISAWNPFSGRKAHILGYAYNENPEHIEALCVPLLDSRHKNTLRQLDILASAGYPIDVAKVEAVAGSSTIFYKQHLMQVLVDAGLTPTLYGELYDTLFKKNGIASGDIEYPDARDAVRAIVADGGIAVLAHPGQLDSWDLVPALVQLGLRGIEYLHESHRTEDHGRVLSLASQYNLLLTGGSDDHGSFGSSVHIGDITSPPDLLFDLLGRDHPSMGAVLPLVIETGRLLRTACTEVRLTEIKDNNHQDLVTKWDTEVETHIVSSLKKIFPTDSFITEEQSSGSEWEGSRLPAGRVWIIDPIDGTANFADSGRDYALSLALYIDGRAEMGLIFDCDREIVYSAVAGKGAKINGRSLEKAKMKKRFLEKELADAIIDLSLNTIQYLEKYGADFEELNRTFRGHRALGCASLSICRVAEGTLDAYISAKLGIWDWAAAWIVLVESGSCAWEGPSRGNDISIRSKKFYMAARNRNLGERLLENLCNKKYRREISILKRAELR